MVNRFRNILEQIEQINEQLARVRSGRPVTRTEINLKTQKRALEGRLIHFGQRYKIVRVFCEYKAEDGVERMETYYFTDIEEFEAIELLRYTILGTIHKLTAISIPVGKPVKM